MAAEEELSAQRKAAEEARERDDSDQELQAALAASRVEVTATSTPVAESPPQACEACTFLNPPRTNDLRTQVPCEMCGSILPEIKTSPPPSSAESRAPDATESANTNVVFPASPRADPAVSEACSEVDVDLAFALKLQAAEEAEAAAQSSAEVAAAAEGQALAEALQEEERAAASARVEAAQLKAHAGDAMWMARHASLPPALAASRQNMIVHSLENEDGDGDDDEEEDPLARMRAAGVDYGPYGPNGQFVTKHDPALSAMANARRADDCLPGHMGNLRGSSNSGSKGSNAAALKLPNTAYNQLSSGLKRAVGADGHGGGVAKGVAARGRVEAKTRATRSSGVLDDSTRKRLLALINRGVLEAVHGVVKSGKESRVFFGEGRALLSSRPQFPLPQTRRRPKRSAKSGQNDDGASKTRGDDDDDDDDDGNDDEDDDYDMMLAPDDILDETTSGPKAPPGSESVAAFDVSETNLTDFPEEGGGGEDDNDHKGAADEDISASQAEAACSTDQPYLFQAPAHRRWYPCHDQGGSGEKAGQEFQEQKEAPQSESSYGGASTTSQDDFGDAMLHDFQQLLITSKSGRANTESTKSSVAGPAGALTAPQGSVGGGGPGHPPPSSDLPELRGVAVKVFFTVRDQLRTRMQYLAGDPRYRGKSLRASKRRLMAAWAEKEFRNLCRCRRAQVPCPQPLLLSGHVLLMEFLDDEPDVVAPTSPSADASSKSGVPKGAGGSASSSSRGTGGSSSSGWPAPQLQEVPPNALSRGGWRRAYCQALACTRALWQRARLVHGDLSAFNLLWRSNAPAPAAAVSTAASTTGESSSSCTDSGSSGSNSSNSSSSSSNSSSSGTVYVIDLGQAIDVHHPRALELLRRDLLNLRTFFARRKVAVHALTTLEAFVVQPKALPDGGPNLNNSGTTSDPGSISIISSSSSSSSSSSKDESFPNPRHRGGCGDEDVVADALERLELEAAGAGE